MTASSAKPIFVCGASRSGTALMRSILNRHSDIWLSGETHYFDDLRVKMKDCLSATLDAEEQRACEDYFLALGHRPYGHEGDPGQSRFSRESLQRLAASIGKGADPHFEAFCRLEAQEHDAERWGEKTPRHVFRIREILEAYPGAQVICMVRDPRAVVASYRDWRNQGGFDLVNDPGHEAALEREQNRARKSYNIIIATMLWKSTVGAALSARAQFGGERVRVQQYESLVFEPELAVRAMFEWLKMDYEPELLDVPVLNSSFASFDQTGGIQTSAVERWKEKLSQREIGIVQSVAGRVLQEAGYERASVRTPYIALGMNWAGVPFAAFRAAMANRDRIGNLPAYIWRRLRYAG